MDDSTMPMIYMTVTREIAREMLSKNTHNRNIRPAHVTRLAADMSAGTWDEANGETIKIACDGVVLDGQHRLLAVVESGAAIKMIVVTGLHHRAQETIDRGSPRSFADVLKLRGEQSANALASIVRSVNVWDKGARDASLVRGASGVVTDTELLRTLDAVPAIRDAVKKAETVRRHVPTISAKVAGLAWHVTSLLDFDDASEFFETLITQNGTSSGDAEYELYHAFKRLDDNARFLADPYHVLAITFKSWNAYRSGEQVGLLRFRPGGSKPEKFPEPV